MKQASPDRPDAPEPRDNLGLLYEALGRLDRAIGEYQAVLEIDPDRLVTMQHLARAYVKAGKKGDELKNLLEQLLATPQDKQWDVWVRGQMIRVGRPEDDDGLTQP